MSDITEWLSLHIYTHTTAWVWRVRHIDSNLQKECMCQGHYGVELSIKRIALGFYQYTVMSRFWRTWVIEEPRGSQFLSYYEPWQCKFNAAYLFSLNSPNWSRRSGTPRQKAVNGRKRWSTGNRMRVSTHSPACLSNSLAHWKCPSPLCSAKLPKTIYN